MTRGTESDAEQDRRESENGPAGQQQKRESSDSSAASAESQCQDHGPNIRDLFLICHTSEKNANSRHADTDQVKRELKEASNA